MPPCDTQRQNRRGAFQPREIAAQGAQDRKLYVVPSLKLVVVRTGQAASDRDFNQQLWQRLMKAVPAN